MNSPVGLSSLSLWSELPAGVDEAADCHDLRAHQQGLS